MPGWVRFKPAADWLAAHRNQAVAANPAGRTAGPSLDEQRQAFEKFMETYASAGGRLLTLQDREALFARFKESLAASKAEQAFAR